MRILSVGRATRSRMCGRRFRLPAVRGSERALTLIEMVSVMAIVSLIVGISYPAVAAGLETVRLSSAADTVASFINTALNRADRRQEVIAMGISLKDNTIVLHSTEAGFERKLELPDGIVIQAVLPE